MALINLLSNIGNSIRDMTKETRKYTLAEMPSVIRNIKSTPVLSALDVTSNGIYTPPAGVDGYNVVNVNVAGSSFDINNYFGVDAVNGQPFCGDNVTNISYGWYFFKNFTEFAQPVCGNNVVDMDSAYSRTYVTGPAACGPNVVNMASAYTDSYVNMVNIGPKVENLWSTYLRCRSLVTCELRQDLYESVPLDNMASAFQDSSIAGNPICGKNTKNLSSTYYNCYALRGAPLIRSKVENAQYSFYNCIGLRNHPIIENGITECNITFAFSKTNIKSVIIPSRVNNMKYAFENCNNLSVVYIEGNITPQAGFNGSFNNLKNISVYVYDDNIFNILTNTSTKAFGTGITFTLNSAWIPSETMYYTYNYNYSNGRYELNTFCNILVTKHAYNSKINVYKYQYR